MYRVQHVIITFWNIQVFGLTEMENLDFWHGRALGGHLFEIISRL
jgi:hypothetical protein